MSTNNKPGAAAVVGPAYHCLVCHDFTGDNGFPCITRLVKLPKLVARYFLCGRCWEMSIINAADRRWLLNSIELHARAIAKRTPTRGIV
jgi:hypothetical protein